jgi:hypothetical protein
MGLEIFEKFTNTYERKARIYPMLLMITPILFLVAGMYGVELEFKSTTIGLISALGILYLAASIARESGKRIEGSLYTQWGGKPTTQLLRYRDTNIDQITKDRYHSFLSKQLGIKFPTSNDEDSDPKTADAVYESATKWLLDHTRDKKKFALLFDENVSYGFRRNCLGIKPFAIIISIITICWPFMMRGVITTQGLHIEALGTINRPTWGSLCISVAMLLIWVFFFTQKSVKTTAFCFAEMLLRACDVLPKKR